MNDIFTMFSYSFMLRTLIVGILISLSAALVGIPLVLRKNSMIGDGLSHVAFGAFALAAVLGLAPLYFALPVVILASFFILRLSRSPRLSGDSIVAIISASSLALGVLAISIGGGVNIDLNSYLFGSILATSWEDIALAALLTILVLALYLFAYHKIFALTFDQDFAKSIGVNTNLYDALLAVICSIVVVLGLRLLGALLISSLIIFPTLTAMHLAKTFRGTVLLAALASILTFIIGLVASYLLATPTGATVVLANLLLFIIVKIYSLL